MMAKEIVMYCIRMEIEEYIEFIKGIMDYEVENYSEYQEAIDWLDMMLDIVRESEES